MVHGSSPEARGKWLMAQGSWLQAHGSWPWPTTGGTKGLAWVGLGMLWGGGIRFIGDTRI